MHLRFSGGKKTKLASNQVDISSVKLHSSHSKGTRKQFFSRIVLAQSPCHIAIKAFRRILKNCDVYNYITLLLDFNFEVLILDEDFNPNIWSMFLLMKEIFLLVVDLLAFQIFQSTKFAKGAHVMWFSLGLLVYRKLHQYPVVLFKMKVSKIQM